MAYFNIGEGGGIFLYQCSLLRTTKKGSEPTGDKSPGTKLRYCEPLFQRSSQSAVRNSRFLLFLSNDFRNLVYYAILPWFLPT